MRILAVALALAVAAPALAVPMTFNHQGRLFDTQGAPLNGAQNVTFALWNQSSGGGALWTETLSVDFDEGYFSAELGTVSTIDPATIDLDDMWMSISINFGPEIGDRQKLASVPFAVHADTATNVIGGVIDVSEIRVGGTTLFDDSGGSSVVGLDSLGCSTNETPLYNGAVWTCVGGISDTTLTESEVEDFITNAPIDLSTFSMVDGSVIVTFDDIVAVATTGDYDDLINTPTLADVATSNDYDDLDNLPTLSSVASSGDYGDLINVPALAAVAASGDYTDLLNAPALADVATSGDYSDLSNTPTFATVATTGAYSDLSGTPTLSAVATSNDYNDLDNLPTLALVATSGAYADLSGAPVTLDDLGCATNEVPVYDGSSWTCSTNPGGAGGGNLSLQLELDEVSGPFLDSSGFGNNVDVAAGGIAAGSGGHAGSAINFSGGHIETGAANSIPDSAQIWAEAWVEPALPLSITRAILIKEGAYELRQINDQIEFAITTTNAPCSITHTQPITAGNWHHVSGWYDGLSVTVEVDGFIEAANCTEGPIAGTLGSNLTIGGRAAGGGSTSEPYAGKIDEVRIRPTAPVSDQYYQGTFQDSTLLNGAEMAQINEWIGQPRQRWKLCYKKSVHGASSSTFHNLCDDRGATVQVWTTASGRKSGGYQRIGWSASYGYRGYTGEAFLFNLDVNKKYPIGYGYDREQYSHTNHGPTYGDGHDVYFNSSMNIGYCYFPYAFSWGGNSNDSPNNTASQELCGVNATTSVGTNILDMEVFVMEADY